MPPRSQGVLPASQRLVQKQVCELSGWGVVRLVHKVFFDAWHSEPESVKVPGGSELGETATSRESARQLDRSRGATGDNGIPRHGCKVVVWSQEVGFLKLTLVPGQRFFCPPGRFGSTKPLRTDATGANSGTLPPRRTERDC
jgi:hypothetical protein